MARAGSRIHEDMYLGEEPRTVVRTVLASGGEFEKLGYRIESHGTDSLVLVRSLTPSVAYNAPFAIAAALFMLGIASGSTHTARTCGIGALICVALAGVLSIVVRTSERVTFAVTPEAAGSRLLVSGTALPQLGRRIGDSGRDQDVRDVPEQEDGERKSISETRSAETK